METLLFQNTSSCSAIQCRSFAATSSTYWSKISAVSFRSKYTSIFSSKLRVPALGSYSLQRAFMASLPAISNTAYLVQMTTTWYYCKVFKKCQAHPTATPLTAIFAKKVSFTYLFSHFNRKYCSKQLEFLNILVVLILISPKSCHQPQQQ